MRMSDGTIPEVLLGGMLFSLAEAPPGGERHFHRWYERDHFYAGCMAGPGFFSARRFIATRDLKSSRFPEPTPITDNIRLGSFLHLYWLLKGVVDETIGWSVDQVLQLYKQNRMDAPRTNISTGFYDYAWGEFRDADGVPPELALEHHYAGVVATMYDRTAGDESAEPWLRRQLQPPAGSPIAMSLAFRPRDLPPGTPNNVPRVPEAIRANRFLVLSFLEANPRDGWAAPFRAIEQAGGPARLIYAAAFIPTRPGTDTYLDEL